MTFVTLGHMILSHTPPVISPEKKRNINNDLAILPSHDNGISFGVRR